MSAHGLKWTCTAGIQLKSIRAFKPYLGQLLRGQLGDIGRQVAYSASSRHMRWLVWVLRVMPSSHGCKRSQGGGLGRKYAASCTCHCGGSLLQHTAGFVVSSRQDQADRQLMVEPVTHLGYCSSFRHDMLAGVPELVFDGTSNIIRGPCIHDL
jgi:hypothetical protein